jgi:hypothetical protein
MEAWMQGEMFEVVRNRQALSRHSIESQSEAISLVAKIKSDVANYKMVMDMQASMID